MKIGIITHPLKNNYGGILQNYALQKYLLSLGHEVLTIDKLPQISNYLKFVSFVKRFLLKFKGSKLPLRSWTTNQEESIINFNTRHFVKNNIKTTYIISRNSEMNLIQKKYRFDAYVVGSDQVWRKNVQRGNDLEFLEFIRHDNSIIKLAYAASFGVDKWPYDSKETKKYSELAKLFNGISVREYSAKSLCKKFLNVDSIQSIDPTLLVTKNEYLSLISKGEVSKSSGNLFCYILDKDVRKDSIISTVANKKKLTAFEVMPKQKITDLDYDIDNCIFPKVESWIKAFDDAEFVITDSFHGTVFSIIFNKPFIAIVNEKRGASRFSSLLKLFSLEHRMVNLGDNNESINLNEVIDFDKVNKIIEEQKILTDIFFKEHLI